VSLGIYCVPHAITELLVEAVGLDGGSSVCEEHVLSAPIRLATGATCRDCVKTPHQAYFVVAGDPLCVRHAADAVFPDDDMGAHDMAHAAYIQLRRAGVEDVY
jgi:hypothetical protein